MLDENIMDCKMPIIASILGISLQRFICEYTEAMKKDMRNIFISVLLLLLSFPTVISKSQCSSVLQIQFKPDNTVDSFRKPTELFRCI